MKKLGKIAINERLTKKEDETLERLAKVLAEIFIEEDLETQLSTLQIQKKVSKSNPK